MTLFHSKKQPNESADKGRTPRKRGIGYYLEIRCRGKLVRTILMDDPDTPLTIGRAADNDLVIPEDDRSCGDLYGAGRERSRPLCEFFRRSDRA